MVPAAPSMGVHHVGEPSLAEIEGGGAAVGIVADRQRAGHADDAVVVHVEGGGAGGIRGGHRQRGADRRQHRACPLGHEPTEAGERHRADGDGAPVGDDDVAGELRAVALLMFTVASPPCPSFDETPVPRTRSVDLMTGIAGVVPLIVILAELLALFPTTSWSATCTNPPPVMLSVPAPLLPTNRSARCRR